MEKFSKLCEKAYELAPLDAATVGHISYILTISGQGCNESNEVKSKYKVDKDACYRLEWGEN